MKIQEQIELLREQKGLVNKFNEEFCAMIDAQIEKLEAVIPVE